MHRYFQLYVFILVCLISSSCSQQFDRPDTSAFKNLKVEINPFYKAVFCDEQVSTQELASKLTEQYPEIFPTYVSREIRLGNPSDILFSQKFDEFIHYADNNELIAACDSAWSDNSSRWNAELSDAFQCMKALIPSAPVPNVYAHVSGFNSKMFMDSTYISFSIEHYLGSDCRFYQWLDVPQYARATKNASYVAPDILRAWLYGLYPNLSTKDDILSDMVYQGRILYCVWRMMPHLSMEQLLGYDSQQMAWCRNCEAQMWGYMAEQGLLYSTKPMDKSKLINEAPFISYFGQNSPGRAPIYCGLRIVMAYMEAFPKTSMEQLLTLKDAQKILMGAGYNPK
ncbi:MAG: hypothetical protein MJZ27_01675 [Bacteroidales bacterium]|nr:hypothetical protein [Bacteroidales bacterium]